MFHRIPPSSARSSAAFALVLITGAARLLAPSRADAVAVAVGTSGISVSSSTAGASWNPPNIIDVGVSFAGIWMTSDVSGIAVGNGNSIYRTSNAGLNWSPVSSPITTTYNDVMFPTASIGYIAATNGQVLKSTNGGTSWTAQTPGAAGSLLAIHFVSATQGCAVGINGAITRTTNGGSSWLDETTGTTTLNDVFFFDANNGWAVGNAGTILRSTNGGDSWAAVTSGTTIDLAAVWFTTPTLGFVCGGDRVLRKTTNGGTSWSAVALPTTQVQSGLFDLMFADPDTGVVVGSGVSAYRTIDGGTTWTVANPDPTATEVLQAVHLGRPPGPTPQVTVNVNALPAGRSFRVDGQTFTTAQAFTWDSGSSHQLEGITPQAINAGERYIFGAWSGGSNSTSLSLAVSPTANATFTANYQRQFLLTMPGVTGGTVQPGTTWQNANAAVQISANDGTGYDFVAWTGSGGGSYTGTNNPATVTMSGAITETADFDPVAIALTFQTSPAGKQVTVDGTVRTTPYTLQTTADVSHTLNVPSPQGEASGSRFAFLSWSDAGAQSHPIDPLVGGTYTANLKTQHFLTTLASPTHGGSLGPADAWFDAGARPTLVPTPSLGWTYFLMQGVGAGSVSGVSSDPIKLQMNGPVTQTAYFSDQTMRTLTVRANPPGPELSLGTLPIGTASTFLWPSGQSLPLSAPATQTAVASVKQWQWKSWSDGGARTHTATPAANTIYTANFDVQFGLEMQAEIGGTTNPPVSESWVDSNTVVTIRALPDASHSFKSWSGTGSSAYNGGNNPAQFTIRGKVNELARFDLVPRLTLDPAIAGRRFVAGEPETIRWDATFASTTPCQLEYKHVIASTWTAIGSATAQTRQFVWTPPDAPQTNLQLRILWPVNVSAGDTLAGFQVCDPYFVPGPALAVLPAGTTLNEMHAADQNGDGIPDLVLVPSNGTIQVRLGKAGSTPGVGSGSFFPALAAALPGVQRIRLGDLDRDGILDVVAGSTGSLLTRLKGGTGGTLIQATALAAAGPYADFALADVSEDGLLDVVGVRNSGSAALCVSRAEGTSGVFAGTFTLLAEVATLAGVERLELADVNRDGILDAIVLAGVPARIGIHFGAQGPTPRTAGFGAARTLDLTGRPADFALADFDENGRLDLLVANDGAAPQIVFTDFGASGASGLLFVRRDTVTSETGQRSVQVLDLDRDSHVDAVFADGATATVRIFGGDGNGSFVLRSKPASGGPAISRVLVHDFAEDGRADLVLTLDEATPLVLLGNFDSCEGSGGAVFLDAPNAAGLSFPIGAEMSIAWHRFQSAESVDLDVSRDGGVTWERIAHGVAHSPVSWTVTPPATVTARVRAHPANGAHLSDVSTNAFVIIAPSVDAPPGEVVPMRSAFLAPFPNPAREGVRFQIDLPAPAVAHLDLYDLAGRRVRTLVAAALPAGRHALAWDGRDDAGRRAAPGVYFARATWEGFRSERRVIRLE